MSLVTIEKMRSLPVTARLMSHTTSIHTAAKKLTHAHTHMDMHKQPKEANVTLAQ